MEIKLNKGDKQKSKFIGILILIVAGIIFFVPFPYTATEAYNEQVPYSDVEVYYEKEPYTTCAGTSFWTGKCNEWKTEYENVKKTKTVNKYRTVQKEREVQKKATLYERWSGQVQWYYVAN